MRWFHHGMKRGLVRCAGAATLAILGASILLTSAHTQAKTTETSCRDLAIPVSILLAGLSLRRTMHGTLCAESARELVLCCHWERTAQDPHQDGLPYVLLTKQGED